MPPADAPPGYEMVAAMIAAAQPKTAGSWIPGENRALQAYRAAMAGTPMALPEERLAAQRVPRSRVLFRIPAKAALAGALVLAGGTAAAAATGSLPEPIQSTFSSALSHVGISIPSNSGNPHPSPNASPHASLGGENSLYGLCTAYASHGTSSQASVPSRLSAAAAAANESVTQFCNSVPNPSSVNPASSPSAHKSDEAGTVQQQSSGSGGPAGPGGAVTHNGTPGPPATPGQGGGLAPNTNQGQGKGQGLGAPNGQTNVTGPGKGQGQGQTTTTVPATTTTTTKSNNGGGHSSGNALHTNNGNH